MDKETKDYLDRKMEPWDNNGMFLVDLGRDQVDPAAGHTR